MISVQIPYIDACNKKLGPTHVKTNMYACIKNACKKNFLVYMAVHRVNGVNRVNKVNRVHRVNGVNKLNKVSRLNRVNRVNRINRVKNTCVFVSLVFKKYVPCRFHF